MSKRDYRLIAAALREERDTAVALHEPLHAAGIEVAARAIARDLGNDNPRFDGLRFLRACGLEDEAIGRQA
jgi:hypothetical protein